MHILWTYLRPHWRLAALALLLAATSQVLALVDPIIFGRIVDEYALNRAGKTEEQLVSGVLRLLGL
ncbi:MAG: ABC transporter ATP-binding protein, partial [Telluria sp.]